MTSRYLDYFCSLYMYLSLLFHERWILGSQVPEVDMQGGLEMPLIFDRDDDGVFITNDTSLQQEDRINVEEEMV